MRPDEPLQPASGWPAVDGSGWLGRLHAAERQRQRRGRAPDREVSYPRGEGLLDLARREATLHAAAPIQTSDGHVVQPWVVLLQAINHATDHRRQAAGMLRALGVAPPRLDGWAFGGVTGAVVPPPE